MNPLFFNKKSEENSLQCLLCPNKCMIKPGKSGKCGIRRNNGGKAEIPFYGKLSAVASDPVEKKPLYRFMPGTQILSVGFLGCNFKCPFCQNYDISQFSGRAVLETTEPEEIVEKALRYGIPSIAYTYSEPLIHFEWVLKCSKLAAEKGLKNVLVTNGFINREPAEEILKFTDAANIDLKSFDPRFYREECGGTLEDVKNFIVQAAEKIHVEITTLIIPGKNDSEEEIKEAALFLSEISRDIPYHITRYFPRYKYTIPPTPAETLYRLTEIASRYLKYVYPGNI